MRIYACAREGIPYGAGDKGVVAEVDNLGLLRVEFPNGTWAWFGKDEVAAQPESEG